MTVTQKTFDLDNLFSTTWYNMKDHATDQIFTGTPFWYWLYSNGRIEREEGGQFIGEQLMYGKNTTVKTVGRGGTVSIQKPENLATAFFNWKYLAGSLVRFFVDEQKNRGKNKIFSWIKSDFRTLELSMVDELETMLLGDGTGNGGLDFDGLGNIVSTVAGGTVAGISSATDTWWDNKRKAYSNSAGFIDEVRNAYNTVSVRNDHPSFIFSSQDVHEGYESTLVGILKVEQTPPGLGDMGFQTLRYKGAGWTFSNHISFPTDNMYFLNERYLRVVIDEFAEFEMTDWKSIPNQLDRVAQVVLAANLTCSNRRMQMVMTNMDTLTF